MSVMALTAPDLSIFETTCGFYKKHEDTSSHIGTYFGAIFPLFLNFYYFGTEIVILPYEVLGT